MADDTSPKTPPKTKVKRTKPRTKPKPRAKAVPKTVPTLEPSEAKVAMTWEESLIMPDESEIEASPTYDLSSEEKLQYARNVEFSERSREATLVLDGATVKVHGKYGLTPIQAEKGSAGFDLHVPEGEDIHMPYNSRRLIDTGVIVQTPVQLFMLLVQRSSTGTKNAKSVRIANTIGIIDSSYQGQNDTIKVCLEREDLKREYVGTLKFVPSTTYSSVISQANQAFGVPMTPQTECVKIGENLFAVYTYPKDHASTKVLDAGSRFAQLIFIPYASPDLLVSALEEFGDSRGGFGSTGK